jgi:hypothetical protein
MVCEGVFISGRCYVLFVMLKVTFRSTIDTESFLRFHCNNGIKASHCYLIRTLFCFM